MLFRSDRKSTRLNSSHTIISYAVFCLKKKNKHNTDNSCTHPQAIAHAYQRVSVCIYIGRDCTVARSEYSHCVVKCVILFFFFLIIRRPPRSPLFPSPTLFRSRLADRHVHRLDGGGERPIADVPGVEQPRSEEHPSELQSHDNLVCRLLLEKKIPTTIPPGGARRTCAAAVARTPIPGT